MIPNCFAPWASKYFGRLIAFSISAAVLSVAFARISTYTASAYSKTLEYNFTNHLCFCMSHFLPMYFQLGRLDCTSKEKFVQKQILTWPRYELMGSLIMMLAAGNADRWPFRTLSLMMHSPDVRTCAPAAKSIAASPHAVPTATVCTGGLIYWIVSYIANASVSYPYFWPS